MSKIEGRLAIVVSEGRVGSILDEPSYRPERTVFRCQKERGPASRNAGVHGHPSELRDGRNHLGHVASGDVESRPPFLVLIGSLEKRLQNGLSSGLVAVSKGVEKRGPTLVVPRLGTCSFVE